MRMAIYSTSDEWRKFFHVLCIFSTLALTGWCLYKYTLDEDVSLVGYVKFNDDKYKRYPAITLCFWNPFYNEKLKQYGPGINTTTYSHFLQGRLWDDRMVSIDYDDVTVSLEDYTTEIGVQYGNFTVGSWKDTFYQGTEPRERPGFYVSNRNGGSKCFSLTMPYVQGLPIIYFYTTINSNIFPDGKRHIFPNFDGSNINTGGFTAYFHLPGQHFRAYYDKKYSWASRENKARNYDMSFTLKNIEVLNRRNKFFNRCNINWENDDNMVKEELIKSVGCNPPHWKVNSPLRICSKREEMGKFRWPTYHDLQKFPLPCNAIEKMQYDFEEVDRVSSRHVSKDFIDEKNNTSWFGINLFFPEPSFKEIKQAQSYDLESFVGNAGGYIGLFLGYSLMCIPNMLVKMYRKIKDVGQERMNKTRHNRNEEDESSSITLSLNELDETYREVMTATEFTSVINLMKHIDRRQRKLEFKVKAVETKLDVILPAYGMTLQTRMTSNNASLWEKRSRFYLSEEVLIK
jgi:hypothetical protein